VLAITIAAILAGLAYASYRSYLERVALAKAGSDIAVISAAITEFKNEYGRFPTDLAEVSMSTMRDPWSHGYQYVSHADEGTRGQWRKDKNIVPINSDFDLYSVGKDGVSVPALTASPSRDDIIRANDGGFIGKASAYDP